MIKAKVEEEKARLKAKEHHAAGATGPSGTNAPRPAVADRETDIETQSAEQSETPAAKDLEKRQAQAQVQLRINKLFRSNTVQHVTAKTNNATMPTWTSVSLFT